MERICCVNILKNIHSFQKPLYSIVSHFQFVSRDPATVSATWTKDRTADRLYPVRTSVFICSFLSLSLYNKWSVLPFSVLSRFRRYCLIFDSLYLDLSDRFLLCGYWLVLFVGEHPFQGSAGRAVAALLWEAQEDGPDERTAAGERGPHVQRHQGKVQKLRIDTGRDYSILKSF